MYFYENLHFCVDVPLFILISSISPERFSAFHDCLTAPVKTSLFLPGCDRRTSHLRSFTPRRRLFLALAVATAVSLVLAITAPHAHAQQQLITYFNFNDSNEISDSPGLQTSTITQNNLTPAFVAGTTLNQYPTDPTGAGQALRQTFDNNGGGNPKTFEFSVNTTDLTNLSLSYATRASVAGITQTLSYSTNGGTTFTNAGTFTPTASFTIASFNLPTAVENQTSAVIFRIAFTGAGSNKGEFNDFDNIQLNAREVPEPGTVGAALLGALALCWHQRRRFSRLRQLFRFSRQPAAV